MATILLIESGGNVCSVALARNNELIGIREENDPKSHATRLTVFIQELLNEQGLTATELSAVAVGRGPGSYTGLRIGVSAAKGICYAAGIPLIAIDSLQALASGITNFTTHAKSTTNQKPLLLCPMIDARRMEVYSALYDVELNKKAAVEALIIDSNSFKETLENSTILFFGSGADKCKKVIVSPQARFIEAIEPSARFMIPLAFKALNNEDFENIAYFEPYYLKDFVAIKAKNKVLRHASE
ncbi:MAG: tRNA (adenosine(37)-N6)-threonylcarbamoyltransferase complex dimerization subunit type 1 TsaB [Bacteroidales bacterium]|nr:tRNA (adenosine(37)-N6)-threonylcarbamoyltransferase complex dimerization subunit type 1 TsaB [Bacteroidales bacterium]MBN2749279.1 tRNA (adenosine(37)-N6)-threonylcarbamoyltransferase complex dimerization subunit type 1 TsaB [Bacteroidales bacterium]